MKRRITHSSPGLAVDLISVNNNSRSRATCSLDKDMLKRCTEPVGSCSLGNKGKALLSLSSIWLHMGNVVCQIALLSTCAVAY